MEPYENLLIDPQLLVDDAFEFAGVPWEVTAAGLTLTRTVADGEWSSRGGALKAVSSTTSAQVSEARRRLGRPVEARVLAFGGKFAVADENLLSLEFDLSYRDGTNRYRSRLRHTFASNLWEYDAGGTGASAFATLLTRDLDEAAAEARWHDFLIALAVDPAKEVRSSSLYTKDTQPRLGACRFDEQSFDGTVSGKNASTAADATLPGLVDAGIIATNITGAPVASTLFFDRLYVAYGK